MKSRDAIESSMRIADNGVMGGGSNRARDAIG